MVWLIYGILAALGAGALYVALPWGSKLIIRNRFLKAAGARNAVFLTFDDGPSAAATPQILAMLKKAGAKATFFVLGKNVERHPDIARRIVANGHEIGEHSYAHCHAWRSGPFKTLQDLVRGGRALEPVLPAGEACTSFRPPFGKLNIVSLLYIWLGRKKVAFWNVDPRDYKASCAQQVADHVIRGLRAGNVILLHDGRYHGNGNIGVTVAALEMILKACREKGLRAASLRDDMPSVAPDRCP